MSVELEHKSMWAMKKLKIDWQRLNGMNELDKFCLKTYESSSILKKRDDEEGP